MGVVVYVLVDVVLQLLPPHYSLVSEAESNLAVGPFGWIMNLNFLGRAATTLSAVVAIGLSGPGSAVRRIGLALVTVAGLSSAVLAFLPTDLPPADDPGLQAVTAIGATHLVVATLGFLAALAGFAVLTVWLRGSPELSAAYVGALALTATAAGGLLSLGLAAAWAPTLLGLAERVCLAGILGWVFVVCGAVRRLR